MAGFVPIEELDVYRVAEQVADAVWDVASRWDYFARDTVGKQLVRAADSIGANLAEGAGEAGSVENRRYFRYARRSLRETRFFLRRAHARSLIPADACDNLRELVDRLGRLLTGYGRSVERRCRDEQVTTRRLADSPTHRGQP